jgi:hypothetical protein
MDLTGQLLRQAIEDEDGEQWELIELPAILPSGESLFPGFWPIEELKHQGHAADCALDGQLSADAHG